jgi:hypothetical protein
MSKSILAVFAALLLTVSSTAPAISAQEGCVTQGAVALAFAQVLGFEVDTLEAAIEALDSVDLVPELWEPHDACVEKAFMIRVNNALRRAVSTHALSWDEVNGAWALVAESIGDPELLDLVDGLPGVFPPTDVPAEGWYPLEGTVQGGGRGTVPVTTITTRTTEASPYR